MDNSVTREPQPAASEAESRRFRYRLRTLLLSVVVAIVACILFFVYEDWRTYLRVPDPKPRWVLDEGRPWTIEFGRGSGLDGLDTVKIDNDGKVVLHRLTHTPKELICEKTALNLSSQSVSEIMDAVSRDGLLGLDKEYHVRNLSDGTQWVLWIKQGDNEKAVYFDNYFPGAITDFAGSLDAILSRNGMSRAKWAQVPYAEEHVYEHELWSSLER